ncbi:MAG: hypothetical protein IPL20_03055 [Saprospiraceae bacterium]|nr:hypothetical protein [Saprospiraceae bacterium]
MIYYTKKGSISVEDKPFAKGGQAFIHNVLHHKALVVKIYSKLTPQKKQNLEQKIEYMVSHDPFKNSPVQIKESAVWPIESVYDAQKKWVGYVMPKVEHAITLTKLTSGAKRLPANFLKFKVDQVNSYNTRLKVLYNISSVLSILHSNQNYTLVDIKPDNVLLTDQGLIRIIDCDSIQIGQNKKVIHFANVTTEEFAPPEHHNKKTDFTRDYISSKWDSYQFGVIAYTLLLNIHPFFGLTHRTRKDITSFEEYVTGGYFPHGLKKGELNMAKPHLNFSLLLSSELRNNFLKCFADGHFNPEVRPTMTEWKTVLFKEISLVDKRPMTINVNQPSQPRKKSQNPVSPILGSNPIQSALSWPPLAQAVRTATLKKPGNLSPQSIKSMQLAAAFSP